jgi:hypothetical protein
MPPPGEYLRRITLAAAMVIDVAVPADGLQNTTLAYHLCRKQIVVFLMERKKVTRMILK